MGTSADLLLVQIRRGGLLGIITVGILRALSQNGYGLKPVHLSGVPALVGIERWKSRFCQPAISGSTVVASPTILCPTAPRMRLTRRVITTSLPVTVNVRSMPVACATAQRSTEFPCGTSDRPVVGSIDKCRRPVSSGFWGKAIPPTRAFPTPTSTQRTAATPTRPLRFASTTSPSVDLGTYAPQEIQFDTAAGLYYVLSNGGTSSRGQRLCADGSHRQHGRSGGNLESR